MRTSILMMLAMIGIGTPSPAAAVPLSEVALYHRCFVRLTGEFPDYLSDPGLQRVRNGQSSAVDACMAVFDSATLSAQGAQERPTDATRGRQVLETFQRLHSSWFLNREFPNNDDIALGTESLYEAGEPAAYVTRALLNPEVPASSILTSQDHLRVLREFAEGTLHGYASNQFVFDDAPVLHIGPVIGIDRPGPQLRSYTFIDDDERPGDTVTFDLAGHVGGGLIGSPSYLLLTVNEPLEFVANGGRKMPRKWAKAILNDVLCRDLPVVRTEDAIPFVVADSQVPFRRQAKCSQCHSTIDRMASTIRGFSYLALYPEGEFRQGGVFAVMGPVQAPAESGWPAVEDPEYAERPTNGTLYFRDHEGQLVELPVEGPAQLGNRLAELDGPYICLAQRYFRYFTGVEAYVGDPQNFPAGPTSRDAYFRNRVIELGRQLRTSGDLRALIEAIFRSPDYRESDFGVSR